MKKYFYQTKMNEIIVLEYKNYKFTDIFTKIELEENCEDELNIYSIHDLVIKQDDKLFYRYFDTFETNTIQSCCQSIHDESPFKSRNTYYGIESSNTDIKIDKVDDDNEVITINNIDLLYKVKNNSELQFLNEKDFQTFLDCYVTSNDIMIDNFDSIEFNGVPTLSDSVECYFYGGSDDED